MTLVESSSTRHQPGTRIVNGQVILTPLPLPGRQHLLRRPQARPIPPVPTYHRVAPASEMVLECGCSRTSSSDNASIVRRRSISARRDPPPIYQTSHRAAASSSRTLYGRSTSFRRKRRGPDLRNISAPLRDTLVRTAYVHPEAGLTAAQAAWLGSSESISRLTCTFDNLPPSFESVLRQLERVRQAKEYDEDLRDLLSEDPHLEEEMRSRAIATVVGSRLA